MCPFLKTASPATLRALSTTVRPMPAPPAAASPCGGTMSRLQLLAHRCPVMGKAMAVQSSRSGLIAAAGGLRSKIHTSRNQGARAVDGPAFDRRDKGSFNLAVR